MAKTNSEWKIVCTIKRPRFLRILIYNFLRSIGFNVPLGFLASVEVKPL